MKVGKLGGGFRVEKTAEWGGGEGRVLLKYGVRSLHCVSNRRARVGQLIVPWTFQFSRIFLSDQSVQFSSVQFSSVQFSSIQCRSCISGEADRGMGGEKGDINLIVSMESDIGG